MHYLTMNPYDESAANVAAALAPLAQYAARVKSESDSDDPRQAGRLRHACEIENAIEAVADFGNVAQDLCRGYAGSARVSAFCEAVRERIDRTLAGTVMPQEMRENAAKINSYCLPLPAHAR